MAQKQLQWMMGWRTNWCQITSVANKTIWLQTGQLNSDTETRKKATGLERWGEQSCTAQEPHVQSDVQSYSVQHLLNNVKQESESDSWPWSEKKPNKNFHKCDTCTATAPSYGNTVYICYKKLPSFDLFIHFIIYQRKKRNSLNITG